jgi:two-component system sensor histidine kinase/response regulator
VSAPKPVVVGGDGALIPCLEQIPGLDLDHGLRMMRGRPDKLVRLLTLFADGHGEDGEQLMRHVGAGEAPAAQFLVHSLKGAAGNVGALEVSATAAALLAALRTDAGEEEIHRVAGLLVDQLKSLVDAISRVRSGVPCTPIAVADGALAEGLMRLERLLEAGDMAANDFALEEGQHLRTLLGESGAALLACIKVFDYEGALAILRARAGRPSHPSARTDQ